MSPNKIFTECGFTIQEQQNVAKKLWVRNLSVCKHTNDVYFGDYIASMWGLWILNLNTPFLLYLNDYSTNISTNYSEVYTFKRKKDLVLKLQELENAAKKN
jgi:hypothetical protein